jgi:hypothetical protein
MQHLRRFGRSKGQRRSRIAKVAYRTDFSGFQKAQSAQTTPPFSFRSPLLDQFTISAWKLDLFLFLSHTEMPIE